MEKLRSREMEYRVSIEHSSPPNPHLLDSNADTGLRPTLTMRDKIITQSPNSLSKCAIFYVRKSPNLLHWKKKKCPHSKEQKIRQGHLSTSLLCATKIHLWEQDLEISRTKLRFRSVLPHVWTPPAITFHHLKTKRYHIQCPLRDGEVFGG